MTTKKCRAKNPATCRYHGKPAKPKHRIYSTEARDWEKTENYLKNILVKNLPDEYVTELTGGNNSTAPDILIKKGDTHCLRIETKIIPSIAGIQMVVNKNETTGTYSTRQGEVFTKKLLHIINNNSEINSKKSVELTGVQAVEAFEAFESKYVDSKVGLFVGQFASNGLFVACEPTKEKLAQFFTPKIITRVLNM